MKLTALLFALAVAVPALPCEHPYVFHRGHEIDSCSGRDLDRRGDYFWFERDGHAYIVRDKAALARIDRLLDPERALGRQQGALGARQGELGRQQGELGRRQAIARDDVEMQRKLAREQSELAKRQSVLAREQSELARKQSAFARDFERQLPAIEDDLIRRGLAQRD